MRLIFVSTYLLLALGRAWAYESTDNKSLGKYDRINSIEAFLKTMDQQVAEMKKDLAELKGKGPDWARFNQELDEIKSRLSAVEKEVGKHVNVDQN